MEEVHYHLFDFRVFENFEVLRQMRIFIWGAAPKGRQIYRTLKRVGIRTAAFCDSDVVKWDKYYDGLPIISPYQLRNKLAEDSKCCIISCVNREGELLKILHEMGTDSVWFLSYWGIKTACVLYHIPLEPERELPIYDVVWKYQKRCTLKNSGDLIEFCKIPNMNQSPHIIIYQPGKVASSTVRKRLKMAGVPFTYTHELTYPSHLWGDELKDVIQRQREELFSREVKIITGVREPLARDYSAFWQPFSSERSYLMPILNKDFQIMYRAYLDLLISKEPHARKAYLQESCPHFWHDEFAWFNYEMKKYAGIDVYDHPFARKAGYQIIRQGNIQMFLYKMEKLDEVMPRLSEFLGTDVSLGGNANLSENKPYYLAYKEFRRSVKIPRGYVRHYYNQNSYMEHFYTEEEQAAYLSQWESQIID